LDGKLWRSFLERVLDVFHREEKNEGLRRYLVIGVVAED